MIALPYEEWRQVEGTFLETIGELERCTSCHGTGEGSGHPCTSCYGIGFFETDLETGEPVHTTKLNPRVYALILAEDIQRWCAWTGDDPVSVLQVIFEGNCPLTATEILYEVPSGTRYAY